MPMPRRHPSAPRLHPRPSPWPRRATLAVAALVLAAGAVTAHAAAAPELPLDEEPEVTIIQRDRDVIEEYRIRGQLYMIRVVPRRGVPYYLVDTDGDGNLETRRNEVTEDLRVPSWILFSW